MHHPNFAAYFDSLVAGIRAEGGAHSLDLSRLRFEGVDLSGLAFRECSFDDAVFEGGSLTGASLSLCFFPAATFRGTDLRKVTMENCFLGLSRFEDVAFDGSTIVQTGFNGASFRSCTFDGSDLFHSRFIGATMTDVGVVDCNLKGVDFRGSGRDGLRFKYSNTEDAFF